MDPVRGTTECKVTAMERGTSSGRSVVVDTSRQRSCAVHPTDTAVAIAVDFKQHLNFIKFETLKTF